MGGVEMKKFLNLAALIVVVLFTVTGCFKDKPEEPEIPETTNGTSYVMAGEQNNIAYSIKNGNYLVENFNIVKADSTSDYIYGVIKFKYIGSEQKSFIKYIINFKDKKGNVLFNYDNYMQNITSVYLSRINYYIDSFVTKEYNIVYGSIIENLAEHNIKIENIAYADIEIEESSVLEYIEQPTKIEKNGELISSGYDSWKQPIAIKGNSKIGAYFSKFIFNNSNGKPVSWGFAIPYNNKGERAFEFEPEETGYIESIYNTPDYEKNLYSVENVLLSWDVPYKNSTTNIKLKRAIDKKYNSQNERNEAILKAINKSTEEMEKSIKAF